MLIDARRKVDPNMDQAIVVDMLQDMVFGGEEEEKDLKIEELERKI